MAIDWRSVEKTRVSSAGDCAEATPVVATRHHAAMTKVHSQNIRITTLHSIIAPSHLPRGARDRPVAEKGDDYNGGTSMMRLSLLALALLATVTGSRGQAGVWALTITELRDLEFRFLLVFGDSGTWREGQALVGKSLADVALPDCEPQPGFSEK